MAAPRQSGFEFFSLPKEPSRELLIGRAAGVQCSRGVTSLGWSASKISSDCRDILSDVNYVSQKRSKRCEIEGVILIRCCQKTYRKSRLQSYYALLSVWNPLKSRGEPRGAIISLCIHDIKLLGALIYIPICICHWSILNSNCTNIWNVHIFFYKMYILLLFFFYANSSII